MSSLSPRLTCVDRHLDSEYSTATMKDFELDEMTNAECKAEFRFYKNDIYKLRDALELPDECNGLIV